MLASTLVLDDASGDDITFTAVYPGFPDGVKRKDVASVPGAERTLNIRHQQQGNAQNGFVDRHHVQLLHDVATPDGTKTITVNFTMNVPRHANVTSSAIHDDVAIVLDLLTTGALVNPMTTTNLDSLLRGES
jgi:hypothetical protein